jgi:hypothetical protein
VPIRRPARVAPLAPLLGLTLLLAACAAGSPPAENHAGLVVLPGEGAPLQACVAFSEENISGETLLARSGLSYSYDARNPMGVIICSIGETGCAYPGQPCFCSCQTPGTCTYWAYFTLDDGGQWVYSPLGARSSRAGDGDVHAWAWLSGTTAGSAPGAPPIPKITFSEICGTPAP